MKDPDWLAAHRVCGLADPMRSNDAEAVAKSEMLRMRPVLSVQRRHGNLLRAEPVAVALFQSGRSGWHACRIPEIFRGVPRSHSQCVHATTPGDTRDLDNAGTAWSMVIKLHRILALALLCAGLLVAGAH